MDEEVNFVIDQACKGFLFDLKWYGSFIINHGGTTCFSNVFYYTNIAVLKIFVYLISCNGIDIGVSG